MKAIAENLFWGVFINTGQTCAALKRLYVTTPCTRRSSTTLAEMAQDMPMGPGLDEGNVLGPLQNKQQFDIVSRLVEDARSRGARIVTGGEPAPELGPHFYRATVVADIDDGAPLVDEEQFGPAIPVIRYSDVDDAIAPGERIGRRASAHRSGASDRGGGGRRGAADRGGHGVDQPAWRAQPGRPVRRREGSGYGLEFGVEGLKAVSAPKVITV